MDISKIEVVMFNFLNKKNNNILAIADGKMIDVATVNDETFSQKIVVR